MLCTSYKTTQSPRYRTHIRKARTHIIQGQTQPVLYTRRGPGLKKSSGHVLFAAALSAGESERSESEGKLTGQVEGSGKDYTSTAAIR